MNDTMKLLCELIKECIDEGYRADIDNAELTSDDLLELYKLSAAHDVAHLAASTLDVHGMLPKDKLGDAFRRSAMLAVYRHEGQSHEMARIDRALEMAGIDFIFLKGSVLCNEYPKPYFRTRSDIDVLVRPESFEAAKGVMDKALGYRKIFTTLHDVSFSSAGDVHVELHHTLREDEMKVGSNPEILARILDSVWDNVHLCEGTNHRYLINDDIVCVYHYSHMAKHFLHGGCGIKPFIDIKVMDKMLKSCYASFRTLAKEAGILTFANCAINLSNVWFGDSEHDDDSLKLESYVLMGGMYGTYKNRMTVTQVKAHGKIGYYLSRIFIPWKMLKQKYRILEKHKWLTPVFEVVRWVCYIFSSKSKKRSMAEMQISSEISETQSQEMSLMLESLGL